MPTLVPWMVLKLSSGRLGQSSSHGSFPDFAPVRPNHGLCAVQDLWCLNWRGLADGYKYPWTFQWERVSRKYQGDNVLGMFSFVLLCLSTLILA